MVVSHGAKHLTMIKGESLELQGKGYSLGAVIVVVEMDMWPNFVLIDLLRSSVSPAKGGDIMLVIVRIIELGVGLGPVSVVVSKAIRRRIV